MYKCEQCTSVFNRKDNLSTHEKIHDGVHFSCTVCTSTFNKKSNLNRHLKKCHGVLKCKIMGGSSYIEQLKAIKNLKTSIKPHNSYQDKLCFKWAIIANHIMDKEGYPVSEPDHNAHDGEECSEVINDPTLRKVYAGYHEVYFNCSSERMCEWVSRAALLLRRLNLDFDILIILMKNNFSDDSVPADETIIQLTFPQLYDFGHVIMQNRQYYIFVQLLLERRRITVVQLEENIQSFRRMQQLLWRLKTNYILRMLLHLDGDSTNFIIERFENLSDY